ncbi:hypothetical protein GFC29_2507 [Anoxybacillus sp. B7M1]|uniref:hypothetical protein n=2 Tax=Bacillales TaxID=1385 RepID=UPI0005CCB8E9|nr:MULTISPECIES: hypothetical protein [unclassified Anoxybacillus]ANB55814.1 hypothetical protein GFC28_2928 [Anoxybacillus sp. B2M1]ANB62507.1 hypothetical protein GFC29_2507 [Anoxybacillus sp. B7M1]
MESIDRVSRLGATLTLFGSVVWITLKTSFTIWFQTFTSFVYLKIIFGIEHWLTLILLVSAVILSFRVISYVWLELITFKVFNDPEDGKEAIKRANKAFDAIFKSITFCGKFMLFVMFLVLAINTFFWIGVIIGAVLFLILYVDSRIMRKKISKQIKVLVNKIVNLKIFNNFFIFLYLFILTVFPSFYLTLYSLEKEKEVMLKFSENQKVNVDLKLKNYRDVTVKINIRRECKKDVSIDVKQKDFFTSATKVMENDGSSDHYIRFLRDLFVKLNLDKSTDFMYYKTAIGQSLSDGVNDVSVEVYSDKSIYTPVVTFETNIIKKHNDIEIMQKNFHLKN